jgi:hypothetical protein
VVYKYLFKKINMTTADTIKYRDSVELEYYLIESEIDYISELSGKKVYGIEIIKNLGGGCFEEAAIINYSCSKINANSALNVISKNEVTPVGLPYVLEDIASMQL